MDLTGSDIYNAKKDIHRIKIYHPPQHTKRKLDEMAAQANQQSTFQQIYSAIKAIGKAIVVVTTLGAAAKTAGAIAVNGSDYGNNTSHHDGGNITMVGMNYSSDVYNMLIANDSPPPAEQASVTSSAPPQINTTKMWGEILGINTSEMKNVSFMFYNATTGEIKTNITADVGGTNYSQYVCKIDKNEVPDGHIAEVLINGAPSLIEGEEQWVVLHPNSTILQKNITYVSPDIDAPELLNFSLTNNESAAMLSANLSDASGTIITEIYRNGKLVFNSTTTNITDIYRLLFTDTGLSPGTYEYTLNRKDGHGNEENSSLGSIIIHSAKKENKKGGGGSSGDKGGGSGGGTSGEQFSNIKYKSTERNVRWSDVNATYYFKGPIKELYLEPKRNLGEIVAQTEVLFHNSSMVPWDIYEEAINEIEGNGGEILYNTNLWVGNLGTFAEKNVKYAEMKISLNSSRVTKEDVLDGSVDIRKYDPENKWINLEYSLHEDQRNRNRTNLSVVLPMDDENIGGNFIIGIKAKPTQPPAYTPTPEKTAEEKNTPKPTQTAPEGTPGFGAVAAILGGAGAAAFKTKRRKLGHHK